MRAKNEDTKIRIYEYINEYIKNNDNYVIEGYYDATK